MEQQAAELLGEPVLAGAMVMPRGYNLKRGVGAGVGGVVGAAVATGMGSKTPTSPANHRGRMHVVVTPTRLVFFERKGGMMKDKLGQLLLEVPRVAVQSFTVGKGMMSKPVTVELADGTVFALEAAWIARNKARAVAATLAQPAATT